MNSICYSCSPSLHVALKMLPSLPLPITPDGTLSQCVGSELPKSERRFIVMAFREPLRRDTTSSVRVLQLSK